MTALMVLFGLLCYRGSKKKVCKSRELWGCVCCLDVLSLQETEKEGGKKKRIVCTKDRITLERGEK